jgi:flavin-dependent thymidylate synthase
VGNNLPMKWADRAMFQAEGHGEVDITTGVVPSVKLLWMTPDPLGAIASMAAMYKGEVIRDLDELTNSDRISYFRDVCNTHLDTPLEAVKFQFLYEGVDRATTHQVVRARHQTYAQESLRFAVIDDLARGSSLPPSLWGTDPSQPLERPAPEERAREEMRQVWDSALSAVSEAYQSLVNRGMPAEDARGLLPHCVATRMVVVSDLRTLKAEAGNRLCTQAQFHWRILFMQIVDAIRNYRPEGTGRTMVKNGDDGEWRVVGHPDRWQFEELANSSLFRPVCYQIAKCPFKASFDRHCNIRERVEIRARHGSNDSREWHKPLLYDDPDAPGGYGKSEGIKNEEWLADPAAARRK